MTQSTYDLNKEAFRKNNFDLIRIFAATQVLIGHSITHLNLPNNHLWWIVLSNFPGVPIFFVTSGFLISASFEKSNSLKIYIQNRLLRILPGFWTMLLVTVVIIVILGFNFFQFAGFKWLLLQFASIVYTPPFLRGFGTHSYNGALWTIPIELQFYFMLPVIYYLQKILQKRNSFFEITFVIFLLAYFLYLSIFGVNLLSNFDVSAFNEEIRGNLIENILWHTFIPHFHLFLLGVLCYKYKIYANKFIKGKGLYWLAAYILLALFLPNMVILKVLLKLLLGIATISCAYTLPYLSSKLLKVDISYGVYIYHRLVINLFVQFGYTKHWIYLLLVLVIAYSLGYISWTFVESRFIKLKKKSLIVKNEVEAY